MASFSVSETIAAIATAPGRSGVAVIRVSGKDALRIGERLAGFEMTPGKIRFAALRNPEKGNVFLDEAVVLAFHSPHSYTGEDVVEFQCHGGAITPKRILEACFDNGARIARRGEFTERAFLNGKLDYEKAQAVIDLIDAKTDKAADDALSGLQGRMTRELRSIYDDALDISSSAEYALDIDEGELPPDFAENLNARKTRLTSRIDALIAQLRANRLRREGVTVVLAGEPNAGKSSLMNTLLGRNRAIVSNIPGTTRDFIEEWLDIDGWPVRLIDTAGLRKASDTIEAEGVQRSETLIENADIAICLVAADNAAKHRDFSALPRLAAKNCINVISKSDLICGDLPPQFGNFIRVSAKTGEGLDELRARIVELLCEISGHDENVDSRDEILSLLIAARTFLDESTDDLVLLGNQVRSAADCIGERIGAVYSEDLLTRLFSRFCVGK